MLFFFLAKRTPVIFAFSAEQAEDDELIAHRLAAILQQAKGSIVKKMQAINTAHGRCVSVRLEQNSVRHLRHLLETDRNSLSPLDASSVQIGNERPISLKRPQSMMRGRRMRHLDLTPSRSARNSKTYQKLTD